MEKQRNLEVGEIVLVETKQKLGKNSYKMARVIKMFLDEAGLCRRVTLEARPRGGNLSLPYVSKDLEQFDMATRGAVVDINWAEDDFVCPKNLRASLSLS